MASAAKPAGPQAPKSAAIPKTPVGLKPAKGAVLGRPTPSSKAVARASEVSPTEEGLPGASKRRPLTKEAKTAIKTVSAILVVLVALILIGKSPTPRAEVLTKLVKLAAEEEAKKGPPEEKTVPVTKEIMDLLLNAAADKSAKKPPGNIYTVLWLAKAEDETDVDGTIVSFVIKQFTNDNVCDEKLLDVLRKRKSAASAAPLLEFCRTTGNTKAAVPAIQTCAVIATEGDFPKFIDIIEFTTSPAIRQAAEEGAAPFLKKSINRQSMGAKLATSLTTTSEPEVKYSLLRLLGLCGSNKAADILKKAFASTDKKEGLAAAIGMASWPDDSMFETLIAHLATVIDEPQRGLTFEACVRFVADPDRTRASEVSVNFWNLLTSNAKSPAEKEIVTRARANRPAPVKPGAAKPGAAKPKK